MPFDRDTFRDYTRTYCRTAEDCLSEPDERDYCCPYSFTCCDIRLYSTEVDMIWCRSDRHCPTGYECEDSSCQAELTTTTVKSSNDGSGGDSDTFLESLSKTEITIIAAVLLGILIISLIVFIIMCRVAKTKKRGRQQRRNNQGDTLRPFHATQPSCPTLPPDGGGRPMVLPPNHGPQMASAPPPPYYEVPPRESPPSYREHSGRPKNNI